MYSKFYSLCIVLLLCTIPRMIAGEELVKKIHKMRRVRDLLAEGGDTLERSIALQLFVQHPLTGERLKIKLSTGMTVIDIYNQIHPRLLSCKWNLMLREQILSLQSSLSHYFELSTAAEINLGMNPTSYMHQILSTFSDSNFRQIMDRKGIEMDACSSKWEMHIACRYSDEHKKQVPLRLWTLNYMFDLRFMVSSVDFQCLPETLEEIRIERFTLDNDDFSETERVPASGINLSQFPPNLKILDLKDNKFSGTINFSKLPRSMIYLNLKKNEFYGDLDFTQLPPGLTELSIGQNKFSGTVDLNNLPSDLEVLDIAYNEFNGNLDFSNLPIGMSFFHIQGNHFSGSLHLGAKMPFFIDVSDNDFNGNVNLRGLKSTITRLSMSFNADATSNGFKDRFMAEMKDAGVQEGIEFVNKVHK